MKKTYEPIEIAMRIRERSRKESALAEELADAVSCVPDGVAIARASDSGYSKTHRLKIPVASASQMIALLRDLPPAPLYREKKNERVPGFRLMDEEREFWTRLGVPLTRNVEYTHGSSNAEATYRWFSIVGMTTARGGYPLMVDAVLEGDPARFADYPERDGRGKIIRHRWQLAPEPDNTSERIVFWPGTDRADYPGHFLYEWSDWASLLLDHDVRDDLSALSAFAAEHEEIGEERSALYRTAIESGRAAATR